MTHQEQLARLQQQIDALLLKQGLLKGEILQLRRELANLQRQSSVGEPAEAPEHVPAQVPTVLSPSLVESTATVSEEKPAAPFDWEQYVGGNLINKIGIAVLLLAASYLYQ